MVQLGSTGNLHLSPTMSVDTATRRLAFIAVLVSVTVLCLLAPFAQVPLAHVAAFIPIYESALLLNDLITAVMLFGHFSILRSKALLVLACGYLFTSLLTAAHALTFPGLFSATGLLGAGSQSTAWIYVFWHTGFPVCVVLYARLGQREPPARLARPGLAIALGLGAAIALAALSTVVATAGHDLLPAILASGHYTLAGKLSMTVTWFFSVAAIAVLWRAPGRTMLDVWLLVVMVAWLCDIALAAVLNGGRYDLGWYAGRIFGLFAASYVLIVLLLESNKLLAKLALAHDHAVLRATQYAGALEELHFKDEEIQAIVQHIVDCVLTTDEHAIVISANPAVRRVFGIAPEHVVGQALSVLVPEMDCAAPAFVRTGEVEGRHQDGRLVPLEMAVTDFVVHGTHRYLVLLRDIGESKKFVAELRQARRIAEQANRAKSVFLSNMSHELRTPLNAILGFGQILASDSMPVTPEKRKEFISHIVKAGKHLLALINEVLDLAKVESGTLSLSQEPVELNELMLTCREMIEPLANKRDIGLSFTIGAGLYVHADRIRLKQVLLNLLSNAVKYNRRHGAVSVAATAAGDRVRITVTDEGHGLSPVQLEQLFQPFNRLGREASEEEGTGIGLVLTKRLVELMGGTIGVDSTVGAGCVFWIELKSTAAHNPARTGSKASIRGALASAAIPATVRTLLYVEDNPANLALVREMVGFRPDLTLLAATDAQSGIDMARQHRPAVILMDINLPGMSGNEAIRILRASPELARTPAIALSANAMPDDIARSMAAGFFAYLTKPIDVDEFFETVYKALAQSEDRARRVEM